MNALHRPKLLRGRLYRQSQSFGDSLLFKIFVLHAVREMIV